MPYQTPDQRWKECEYHAGQDDSDCAECLAVEDAEIERMIDREKEDRHG